jgi:hypothetical protein
VEGACERSSATPIRHPQGGVGAPFAEADVLMPIDRELLYAQLDEINGQ